MQAVDKESQNERAALLTDYEQRWDVPLAILGLIWLVFLIIDFTRGLTVWGTGIVTAFWIVFVLDFVVRILLSEDRTAYLRRNFLSALSIAVPPLRILAPFRVYRLFAVVRVFRGVRLLRVVASFNRGMGVVQVLLGKRGFGYVIVLTILLDLIGSAGMYTLESPNPGYTAYSEALWWTSMVMITLGSGNWPITAEGRVLGFLLAVYAFAVLGFTTATLATFFIGAEYQNRDKRSPDRIQALTEEIRRLRRDIGQGTTKMP